MNAKWFVGSGALVGICVVSNVHAVTFTPARVFPTGSGPHSMAAADLDGDGDMDVVTANAESDNLAVLINTSTSGGTLSNPAHYGNGKLLNCRAIALGDINGDSKIDMVATSSQIPPNIPQAALAVFLGDGSGTFPLNGTFYPVESSPYVARTCVLQDMDVDGFLDVACGYYSDRVTIAWGGTGGTFPEAISLFPGVSSFFVETASLNADGFPDICASATGGGTTKMFPGAPARTFATAQPIDSHTGSSRGIAAADFNGDGDIDLGIAKDGAVGQVWVYDNDGLGNFSLLQTLDADTRPETVVATDIDDDSDADLVLGFFFEVNTLMVFLNTAGVFSSGSAIAAGGTWNHAIVTKDMNGDNKKDIVTALRYSDQVSIVYQTTPFRRGDADLSGGVDLSDAISTLMSLYLGSGAPECSEASDANDDGQIDLADPISTLQYLYLGGSPPPLPGPTTCSANSGNLPYLGCANNGPC